MEGWKVATFVLAGVLAGSLLGGPVTTSAVAPQQFKECGWYCGFDFTKRNPAKLAQNAETMPEGWTVVAGGGTQGALCAMLCR